MSRPGLESADVLRLLADLEDRLSKRGVALDIQIVGGAALLLHRIIDRATDDIDAQYASAIIVDEVVEEMAAVFGLPSKWLNSNAAAHLPEETAWIAGPAGTSKAVRIADLQTLAAMKLAAERQKDIEDLGLIALALGIEDPETLVRIAYLKYGNHSLSLNATRENYLLVAEESINAGKFRGDGGGT
ncbi:DUF6036 family nucleotidyltransferase [Arthrobacter flavus]|uniref:DUF6036 family nucleotidyltransferase n=1 Tax=Arthrobacter flavus TaxID=95172 RepID=A0ABW4Q704_9MICC